MEKIIPNAIDIRTKILLSGIQIGNVKIFHVNVYKNHLLILFSFDNCFEICFIC